MLHVMTMDARNSIFHSNTRIHVPVRSRTSRGSFAVASLTQTQARQAIQIINSVQAPRNGIEDCQDWIVHAATALEEGELVPQGTSRWLQSLVGQPSETVENNVGHRWVRTSSEEREA